jgi:hypothetical protein
MSDGHSARQGLPCVIANGTLCIDNRKDRNNRSQFLFLKVQCVQVSGAPHESGSPSAADLARNVSRCPQVRVSRMAAPCVATALGKSCSEAGAATILFATAEVVPRQRCRAIVARARVVCAIGAPEPRALVVARRRRRAVSTSKPTALSVAVGSVAIAAVADAVAVAVVVAAAFLLEPFAGGTRPGNCIIVARTVVARAVVARAVVASEPPALVVAHRRRCGLSESKPATRAVGVASVAIFAVADTVAVAVAVTVPFLLELLAGRSRAGNCIIRVQVPRRRCIK